MHVMSSNIEIATLPVQRAPHPSVEGSPGMALISIEMTTAWRANLTGDVELESLGVA